MKHTFKTELQESGRYEAVVNLIEKIINNTEFSFPLSKPYINDKGVTIWRVKGDEVAADAEHLLNLTNADSIGNTNDKFYALSAYVDSMAYSTLHNIAVSLTHQSDVTEDEIERARVWSILENMIDCWNINENGVCDWTIPSGWRAQA